MNIIEKARVISFHRQKMKESSSTPANALGWTSEVGQRKRLEVLSGIAIMDNCSVLDMGCGYGNLKEYLDQIYSDVVYVGVDQMKEFIETAQKRYSNSPGTSFIVGDFVNDNLPQVDYILASGSLSYQTENTRFIFEMIDKMYQTAQKGIAFNLLDEEHFQSGPMLRGYNKEEIYDYCASLCPDTMMIIGYLPDDFTIVMSK